MNEEGAEEMTGKDLGVEYGNLQNENAKPKVNGSCKIGGNNNMDLQENEASDKLPGK